MQPLPGREFKDDRAIDWIWREESHRLPSGDLRTCRNLVIIATKIHASRGDVLTGAMLQSAHRLLVSRRDFSAVQGSLNDSDIKPVARVG